MIRVLLIGLLSMIFSNLSAQNRVDLVYLKSGSTLKGTLQSYEKGQSIVFLLNSGDTLRSSGASMDQIKGIRVGKKNKDAFQQRTEGLWHQYELGLNIETEGGFFPQGAFQATVGHQWNRMLKIGLGAGVEALDDFNVFPIFAAYQGEWYEGRRVTPFHFVNLGYSLAGSRAFNFEDEYMDIKGGVRFNPGLGLKFHKRRSYFTISVGYLMQNMAYSRAITTWIDWNTTTTGFADVSRSFRQMSIRFGIGF